MLITENKLNKLESELKSSLFDFLYKNISECLKYNSPETSYKSEIYDIDVGNRTVPVVVTLGYHEGFEKEDDNLLQITDEDSTTYNLHLAVRSYNPKMLFFCDDDYSLVQEFNEIITDDTALFLYDKNNLEAIIKNVLIQDIEDDFRKIMGLKNNGQNVSLFNVNSDLISDYDSIDYCPQNKEDFKKNLTSFYKKFIEPLYKFNNYDNWDNTDFNVEINLKNGIDKNITLSFDYENNYLSVKLNGVEGFGFDCDAEKMKNSEFNKEFKTKLFNQYTDIVASVLKLDSNQKNVHL